MTNLLLRLFVKDYRNPDAIQAPKVRRPAAPPGPGPSQPRDCEEEAHLLLPVLSPMPHCPPCPPGRPDRPDR